MSAVTHVTTNSLSTEYTTLCTINVVGSILSGGVDIGNLLLNTQQTLTGDFILETNAPAEAFYLGLQNTNHSFQRLETQSFLYTEISSGQINTITLSGVCYRGSLAWSGTTGSSSGQITPYQPFTAFPKFHINYSNLESLIADDQNAIVFDTVTALTAIRFPTLKACSGFSVVNCVNLRELELNNLEYIIGAYEASIGGYTSIGLSIGTLSTQTSPLLTNITFPKLKYIQGALIIGGYNLTTSIPLEEIDFSNLQVCTGRIEIGNSVPPLLYNNLTESNIKLPNLISCGGISLNNLILQTFSLPKLKRIGSSFSLNNCPNLTGVNMSELEYIIGGYLVVSSNTNTVLSSIRFPNLKYLIATPFVNLNTLTRITELEIGTDTLRLLGTNLFQCNQYLTQTSVDNILKTFARLDGTNDTAPYSAGTIVLAGNNSIPSYTGGVTLTANGSSFIRGANIVNVSLPDHNLTDNDLVTFTGNSVAVLNGTYYVTVIDPSTFQYTTPGSGGVQGGSTVTLRRTTVATDGFKYFQLIAQRGVNITINMPS
jgi:hypothetical protein